jgi:hypothetical protein
VLAKLPALVQDSAVQLRVRALELAQDRDDGPGLDLDLATAVAELAERRA